MILMTVKPRLTDTRLSARMPSMSGVQIVTLTTDFGLADPYVGAMRGVILSIIPHAQLVDITHEIPPQEIRQTAFVLYAVWPFFPPRTIHLVVVDPGVGSRRRPIAGQTAHGLFVGPDNGVFSYVMAQEPVNALVELVDPQYRLAQVSQTFHGRDIFAPAAAHLAAGVPLHRLGPAVHDPVMLAPPALSVSPGRISGEVLCIDHFGNAITSIGRLSWDGAVLSLEPAFAANGSSGARIPAAQASVSMAGRELRGVRRTYADVDAGEVLALVGSTGHLELAVREGSGADALDLQPGDVVVLRW